MKVRICDTEDCGKKHYARGLCRVHYTRLTRTGVLTARKYERQSGPCSECERPAASCGLCMTHYVKQWTQRQKA